MAQQQITARAVVAARRAKSDRQLLAVVVAHQRAAAREAIGAVPAMLAEQGIAPTPVAMVVESAFARTSPDGRSLAGLLAQAANEQALAVIVATTIQDTSRVAAGVATTVRPHADGHVRVLSPPSCARCAILGGRFYRWSEGFLRHPRCDCTMAPSNAQSARHLVSSPIEAFRAGQVTGMSVTDVKAVAAGAEMSAVVNIRRTEAGLSHAGRVVLRGGIPTPESIYRIASDRTQALALLKRYGYIR